MLWLGGGGHQQLQARVFENWEMILKMNKKILSAIISLCNLEVPKPQMLSWYVQLR